MSITSWAVVPADVSNDFFGVVLYRVMSMKAVSQQDDEVLSIENFKGMSVFLLYNLIYIDCYIMDDPWHTHSKYYRHTYTNISQDGAKHDISWSYQDV